MALEKKELWETKYNSNDIPNAPAKVFTLKSSNVFG